MPQQFKSLMKGRLLHSPNKYSLNSSFGAQTCHGHVLNIMYVIISLLCSTPAPVRTRFIASVTSHFTGHSSSISEGTHNKRNTLLETVDYECYTVTWGICTHLKHQQSLNETQKNKKSFRSLRQRSGNEQHEQ